MSYATKIENLIGNTPLVDLSALVDGRATLLGKREATNPGGSVKDRIARAMVDAAEADGSLAPGGTIIRASQASGRLWCRARAHTGLRRHEGRRGAC